MISPLLIPLSPLLIGLPVHIKHNAGDMRRRIVLDMAIGQRGRLRADKGEPQNSEKIVR